MALSRDQARAYCLGYNETYLQRPPRQTPELVELMKVEGYHYRMGRTAGEKRRQSEDAGTATERRPT